MPKAVSPTTKLATNQVSKSQQVIAELLNPDIEITRKEALAKSPVVNVSEQIDTKNLPDHLLIEISNAGLTDELQRVPRCFLTFSKKKPLAKQFCRFVSRYGKIHSHI